MDYAKGKVKKYSREYTRTLKDGEKKKYKTEQVQITIPKQQNIFNDDEEVVILHDSDKNKLESQDDVAVALSFHNHILKEETTKLNEDIKIKDSIIDNLNKKIDYLNKEIENLNSEKIEDEDVVDEIPSDAEFLELQKSNISLLEKNDLLQSELENAKIGEIYQKGLANKFRNFIIYKSD